MSIYYFEIKMKIQTIQLYVLDIPYIIKINFIYLKKKHFCCVY